MKNFEGTTIVLNVLAENDFLLNKKVLYSKTNKKLKVLIKKIIYKNGP